MQQAKKLDPKCCFLKVAVPYSFRLYIYKETSKEGKEEAILEDHPKLQTPKS